MARFTSLSKNEMANVSEDFKSARRIEQYRVSSRALYLPEGFRWKYIPLADITGAEESFRVISAGHCVPIREKRPELDLAVGSETVHIQLEKPESMRELLRILQPSG